MTGASRCVHCGAERSAEAEHARVESNVRAFRGETFEVWRCGRCGSIHASEPVDLDHYYTRYPAHRAPSRGRRYRLVLRERQRRLERSGLTPAMSFLDFGCGNGTLLQQLQASGYADVHGYDEYSAQYNDPAVLDRNYDFVLLQDVIEHADEPQRMLEQINSAARPGATIVVGTADADALSLEQPARNRHELHVPFHRHIYSKRALIEAGVRVGWSPLAVEVGSYADTRWPWVNYRTLLAYLDALGGDVDAAYEPTPRGRDRLRLWPMLAPAALLWAFFGSWAPLPCNVTVIFRRGTRAV